MAAPCPFFVGLTEARCARRRWPRGWCWYLGEILQRLHRAAAASRLAIIFLLTFSAPALATLFAAPPPLPTYPPDFKIPTVEVVGIDFGFSGTELPLNWFAPVTVWLTSRDKAMSGTLSFELEEERGQKARFSLDFSTTPGRITPHQLCIFASKPVGSLKLSVETGGADVGVTLSDQGMRGLQGTDLRLPGFSSATFNIITIGDCRYAAESLSAGTPTAATLPDVNFPALRKSSGERTDLSMLWQSCVVFDLAAQAMPRAWAAYESAAVVVINADVVAECDPIALDALITWRDAGGRLLIIPDAAGVAWQRFFDPTLPLPIRLLDQQLISPEAEFDSLMQGGSPVLRTLQDSSRFVIEGAPQTSPSLPPNTVPVPRAAQNYKVRGRPVQLAMGNSPQPWMIHWYGYGAVATNDAAPASPLGLFATGPVKLGLTGVLAAPPHLLTPSLNQTLTTPLYRAAILELIGKRELSQAAEPGSPWSGMQQYSQGRGREAAAIRGATDLFQQVPTLGVRAFAVIIIAMMLLAGALFAVDGFIIRRRTKHASATFVTASLWITIAAVGAGVAPLLFRSGFTHISRASFVDSIAAQPGTGYLGAITGIFAGKPIVVGVSSASPGSFFRRPPSEGSSEQNRLSPPFHTRLTSAVAPLPVAGSALAPSTESMASLQLTACLPMRFPMQQWTSRSLLDIAPTAPEAPAFAAFLPPPGTPAETRYVCSLKLAAADEIFVAGHIEFLSASGEKTVLRLNITDATLDINLSSTSLPAAPLQQNRVTSPQATAMPPGTLSLLAVVTEEQVRADDSSYDRAENWFQSMSFPAEMADNFPSANRRSDAFNRYLRAPDTESGECFAVAYIRTRRPTTALSIDAAAPVVSQQVSGYRILVTLPGRR